MAGDCIFCKIIRKELPAEILYEDERVIAFPDIRPVAPVHILVIPKKHIPNLAEADAADAELLGQALMTLPRIAEQLGIADAGYRTVINTRDNGGQTVYHLHFHILGGRFMTWPPG